MKSPFVALTVPGGRHVWVNATAVVEVMELDYKDFDEDERRFRGRTAITYAAADENVPSLEVMEAATDVVSMLVVALAPLSTVTQHC